MITVKKKRRSNETLKYSHAYDEFGSLIGITAATELSLRKWYLYPDKQVELTLAAINTDGQQIHWRTKQHQKVIIDGREYEYNHTHDSESYEHKQAKGLIIERGWFTYKGDKVLIQNQREEVRILDGKFRCDILAELMDKTPCAIEIIKTSDISKGKENRINELQLLTFKVYIDDKGNQITNRDKIIGNREIESINQRIQEGEGKLAEKREFLEQLDKERKKKAFKELSTFEAWLNFRITRIRDANTKLNQTKVELLKGVTDRREYFTREIQSIEPKYKRIKDEIDRVESEIRSYKAIEQRVGRTKSHLSDAKRIKREIEEIEIEFKEIAKNCEIEWFRNKWMQGNHIDKLTEIKYWTT